MEFHIAVFWACVGIACVIFGIMLVAFIRHQKVVRHSTQLHTHAWREIIWVMIPLIIVILMAFFATKGLTQVM